MTNQGRLVKTGRIEYKKAWDLQTRLHQARLEGRVEDLLILTEHPHTYTIGKAGGENHLLTDETALHAQGISVFRIDRGGDITYHGPGQLVGYPILDLHKYYLDLHRFLRDIEEVLIQTLSEYGIAAGRVKGLTGVWVDGAKIAAIGVKVSRWITMHGFALNAHTDLSYFGHIVPCGIVDKPVTSMKKLLGSPIDMMELQNRIASKFVQIFEIDFQTTDINDLFDENLKLTETCT